MENKDFQKIQITVSINIKTALENKLTSLGVDLAYPNSSGEYAWKGTGRKYFSSDEKFETFINSDNEEMFVIRPILWSNFNEDGELFILEFIKTLKPSKLKFKLFLNTPQLTKVKTFEFWDTKRAHKTPFIDIKTEILEIGN